MMPADTNPEEPVTMSLVAQPAAAVGVSAVMPAMADDNDRDGLLLEVDYYEGRPRLGPAEFDRYVRAESALENLIVAEVNARTAEFEYPQANTLLSQVVQLNTTMREIAEREIDQTDPPPDPPFRDQLAYIRDATNGAILLFEGLRLTNEADERRVAASDFEGGERCLKSAMDYFGSLAGSDLPLSDLGALRYTLAEANAQLLAGLQQMRFGDFRGAYDRFDNTHVTFKELLSQAEEYQSDSGESDQQHDELRRDLADGLRNIRAVQSFVETLREAQHGNYREASVSGREAVAHYERILREAVARGVSRDARMLYEMELARVAGWVFWACAEFAVDECRWDDCREQIRLARAQWSEAGRIAARHVLVGMMSQRPETGNTDMLLQSTLRRCEREAAFRKQISTLEANLDRTKGINISQVAQGGHQVMSADRSYNIGNVAAGQFGDNNTMHNASVQQQNVGVTDFKELAGQLTELRQVMAAAARSPQEQEAVHAVDGAEEAARRNDENGVRRGLARAGRWALQFAEQLALTAATTAIKASIGG